MEDDDLDLDLEGELERELLAEDEASGAGTTCMQQVAFWRSARQDQLQ